MKFLLYKFNFIVIILSLNIFNSFSQSDDFKTGARSRAFADASLTFIDHWAAFNNPAALAFVDHFSFGFFAENRFNISELNNGAIVAALPTKKSGTFAIDFYSLNNSVVYSKQKIGLAYAKNFTDKFAVGLQFNLLRTNFENYGINNSFCADLGIFYKINKDLHFAVYAFNPTASKYTDTERIPTYMGIGLNYIFEEKTNISIEIENHSEYQFSAKGGLGYQFSDKFGVQLGFKSNPFASSFGMNFSLKNFNFQVSFFYLQQLGATPGISIDYIKYE